MEATSKLAYFGLKPGRKKEFLLKISKYGSAFSYLWGTSRKCVSISSFSKDAVTRTKFNVLPEIT